MKVTPLMTVMTAETITDDQLWDLYNAGAINAYQLMMARSSAPNWRSAHRARCALIFNERNTDVTSRTNGSGPSSGSGERCR